MMKVPVLLGTGEGRFRLRIKFAKTIGDLRLRWEGKDYFIYGRPDRTRFVYLKDNLFSSTIYGCPEFELAELRLLAAVLSKGGTFIDGGANIGLFSTYIAEKCPAVKLISIECYPPTFALLQRVIKILGHEARCDLKLHALGSRDGAWVVNSGPRGFEEGNSVKEVAANSQDSVQTITLSSTLKDVKGHSVVKLDIEGYEYDALQGLESHLLREEIEKPMVLFEMSNNPKTTEIEAWFKKVDYHVFFAGGFGQGPRIGTVIDDFKNLPPVCNLFAVPNTSGAMERFQQALNQLKKT